MKTKLLLFSSLACASSAFATITLNTAFGVASNSAGTAVPDGTLWALVVDGGNSSFAGGFGLNATMTAAGANVDFVSGQTFSLGSLFGSDRVFALGGFNGAGSQSIAGSTFDAISLDPVTNTALVAGRQAAFYFFPGVTFTSAGATYTIGSQIGGINGAADVNSGTEAGLIIPADGSTVGFGLGTSALGGSVADSSFRSVVLIPEPSSALLGVLGGSLLLRRRRD